ncbi:MAG: hypothetical protein IPH64_09695 [Comamonadaceae bacterium]|nr:hypothetical protein [Comamonadaceae bacterium]
MTNTFIHLKMMERPLIDLSLLLVFEAVYAERPDLARRAQRLALAQPT